MNGFRLRVRRALGWTEAHNHAPGAAVHAYNNTVVIAVKDGYLALTEWTPAAPATQTLPVPLGAEVAAATHH